MPRPDTNAHMKLAAPLVVALIAAVAAVPATAAVTPIPQNPADLNGLKLFTGHKAKRHPVAAPRVPRHPFMAVNGRNAVHNDAYQTDTYRNLGPLGGEHARLLAIDRRRRRPRLLRHHDRLRQARSPHHHLHLGHDRRAAPDEPGPQHGCEPHAAPAHHPAGGQPPAEPGRRLLLRRQQGPRGRLDRAADLRRRGQGQHAPAGADLRPQLGDPGRRPAQLRAARLERPTLVREPSARDRRRPRPRQRQGAPHDPDQRGDRQLVRDGRDRWRVRRDRQGAVPLRHHPPGQAQDQLARALQERRHREAGPVRRRLRHHADPDGQAVPLDRGQRRPHERGGPAARGAPEAGPASARVRAARLQEGQGRHGELDHRHRASR